MTVPRRSLLAAALMCLLAAFASAALMHRTQTVIDVPAAGQDVALSALEYKSSAFDAKIVSVRLEPHGDPASDPTVADWRFVGSNSDGQQHRVEIFVRLLDASGKQIEMFSKSFILPGGTHDQACVVPMQLKAEHWKAAKSVRIVTDWLS
jgi:hypothetical protein